MLQQSSSIVLDSNNFNNKSYLLLTTNLLNAFAIKSYLSNPE